ncbi:MAG: contractile injection system protein, VgrG/Pvc8 family [Acidimicrobiia bacterium]|nr:contractile injection system protein, VgrG/Pvc8 family [Acidimicrobiia bacterium]
MTSTEPGTLASVTYTTDAPVVLIDDEARGELGRDLRRLDVEEDIMGLRTLVARFHGDSPDSDGSADQLAYLDGDVIDLGRRISVVIGPPGDSRTIFTGTLSAIEAGFEEGDAPTVSVYAEDALMGLRFRQRTATWTDMTDADIVSAIAADHGLGSETDVEGPTYPLVQQAEESDLAFIRQRALRINAEIWIDGDDVLHFAERERRPGVELVLTQGNDLLSATARVDLAHQRSEVTFRGWDDSQVAAIAETADGAVVAAEVAGGRTGPDVVAGVYRQSTLSRSRRDILSAERGRHYAEAEMRRRARSFVTVEGTTNGSPDLIPGTKLDLRRVGAPFNGPGYRVTWVHHGYDLSSGHRTNFRAERPALGAG